MAESLSREVMRAIFDGDVERFEALVAQGFDVHTVTQPDNWNLLHRALVSLSIPPIPRMIEHLVRRGVGVNVADRYGNTPLHYAARRKDKEDMEVLLQAGAHVDVLNNHRITPLRLMLSTKPTDLAAVEVLLKHGADPEQHIPGSSSVVEYARTISHDEGSALVDLLEKYRKRKD